MVTLNDEDKDVIRNMVPKIYHCEKCGLGDYFGTLFPNEGVYLVLLTPDMDYILSKRFCKGDYLRLMSWLRGESRFQKRKDKDKGHHTPLSDYLGGTDKVGKDYPVRRHVPE